MKTKVFVIMLALFVSGFAARGTEANKPAGAKSEPITDVNTIINKANIVAYYQAGDGMARVNMNIIDSQGRQRGREFNILRKDVNDGGDQKYFVYFLRTSR